MFKENIEVNKLNHDNIIQVGTKIEITKLVENFYTKNPFPNYDDFETIRDLIHKVETNEFTLNFKKFCGLGKKIIEVGSGTSQLSIALASGTNNEVIAFDPTLESLRLGMSFAKKNNVNNCTFVNGDIFADPFIPEYFDIVWCSGVLHHTKSAKEGFNIIVNWVKIDGYVVIGLYNRYGRMRTVFRQILFKLLGKGKFARVIVSFLDPILRKNISNQKKLAWFQDQYEHPVETLHTLDDVIEWFEDNNVEFISSIPSANMENGDYKDMFKAQTRGTLSTRIFSQISMLFSPLGSEGGLFIVIGKKK
jgi:ubiquinone/menaquinone biosynthesis C-methylase UbiE